MELLAPKETIEEAHEIIEKDEVFGMWTNNLDDESAILRILVDANRTELLTDTLADKFSHVEGFRIMLFEIQATLPQVEKDEESDKQEKDIKESEKKYVGRVSREELYSDVSNGAELNWVYLGLVLLSTLVAGVGLVRDDVAVIIGAMVIAPLLGPNVSMALSVTLGDLDLGWESLKTNAAGLLSSLVLAVIMGLIMHVDLESEQLVNKTTVNWGDITIALSAGGAGVLAYTRGVPAAIVGVMVAVALLPPLVNVGLLIGAGYMNLALGSIILTVTNLICINLAGILTFLVQGVQPRSWWEVEKAKKATRTAISIWVALLMILAIIIWYWNLTPPSI